MPASMSAIDPQRWQRLRLLDAALDREESERVQFAAALNGDDAELRDDLQRLLQQHARDEHQPSLNPYALVAPLILGEAAAAAEEDRVGRQVGAYRLLRLIGSGGMGSVYLAERSDENLMHRVALKVVRAEAVSPAARERFERERQILAGSCIRIASLQRRRPDCKGAVLYDGVCRRCSVTVPADCLRRAVTRVRWDRRRPRAGLCAPGSHRTPRRQAVEHPGRASGRRSCSTLVSPSHSVKALVR
jgi:hypothetical protein